jgi:preprotein translocase subunit SecE
VAGEARIGSGRTPSRRDARPAGEPEPRTERRGLLGGARQFVVESWAELQKVEWPKNNQLIQGTVVVLVACMIVGVFLYLNDQLWKVVVQKILLK